MGHALIQAAAEAGLRMTLLDTCYLSGGLARPRETRAAGRGPAAVRRRRRRRWAARVSELGFGEHGMIARTPRPAWPFIRSGRCRGASCIRWSAWAHRFGAPLHVHLSEQRAENEACQAVYGCHPARVLYAGDVLGPRTTVVHATHVDADDVELLGGSQAFACLCPTTERDLGDGLARPGRWPRRAACSPWAATATR